MKRSRNLILCLLSIASLSLYAQSSTSDSKTKKSGTLYEVTSVRNTRTPCGKNYKAVKLVDLNSGKKKSVLCPYKSGPVKKGAVLFLRFKKIGGANWISGCNAYTMKDWEKKDDTFEFVESGETKLKGTTYKTVKMTRFGSTQEYLVKGQKQKDTVVPPKEISELISKLGKGDIVKADIQDNHYSEQLFLRSISKE